MIFSKDSSTCIRVDSLNFPINDFYKHFYIDIITILIQFLYKNDIFDTIIIK